METGSAISFIWEGLKVQIRAQTLTCKQAFVQEINLHLEFRIYVRILMFDSIYRLINLP